ncbi:hypothetical protein [Nonomuraea cavernae]|uniref:hypothetical protein n=1 Tax=Nonomuraea cavernae TaxID=2045107 RepID=UPI00166B1B6F|nr:hypothetical protein [Nonomuraea cavernae]MCA2187555.1 hypothetical protein [Nonomuraea cavernae]
MIVPLVGLFLLIMIPIWRDDARLDAFYDRVVAYPLPPNSRDAFSMDRDATFGKNLVGGSGSYCDYRVRITLQTALTPQEIHRHYDNASIAGAESKAMISLYFRDEDSAGGRRVIVEAYDSHDWDGDWRCY